VYYGYVVLFEDVLYYIEVSEDEDTIEVFVQPLNTELTCFIYELSKKSLQDRLDVNIGTVSVTVKEDFAINEYLDYVEAMLQDGFLIAERVGKE